MKYEVAYISGSGNTEKLAHGIADSLPQSDTFVTDLSCEEVTEKADVYIVGFGMKKDAIPLRIMETLERLEGKTILLFVTASVKPADALVKEIERRLDPFMPCECDYKGMYLCPGQVSEETIDKLSCLLECEPENEKALAAMDNCKNTLGHPDREDIAGACEFVRNKLDL